jgi:ceramide glucosyltransferase
VRHDLFTDSVLTLACVPLAYYVFAIDTARRFFAERSAARGDDPLPPVSVLKPVRGLDRHGFDHFATLCRQDYPEYEILFAVADEDDPAVPVIRRLIDQFPHRPIRLLTGGAVFGANSKTSKLCSLAAAARYDLLVISDSDISVPATYLREVVRPFHDPAVGLVTCLYRGASDRSLQADLEAIGISTDFVPGVLVARRLEGLRFALGATMAVTRAALADIGGFEALVDYCADDYELGRRIAACGRQVVLAPCTVSTGCAAPNVGAFLRHQLRWAVTVRHSRPGGYYGRLIAANGLPWAAAVVAVAQSQWIAAAYLVAYAALRLLLAWTVGVRGLHDPVVRSRWWLLPVWDATAFVISMAALLTNRIEWRGRSFQVRRGKLVAL